MSRNKGRGKSRSAAEIFGWKPTLHLLCEPCENRRAYAVKGALSSEGSAKRTRIPSCKQCNNGTNAADSAVAFLARIDRFGDDTDTWQVQEAVKYLAAAEQGAPGFSAELFNDGNSRDTIMRTPGGLLIPLAETHVGAIGKALLDVWAAKLGMSLYNEHVGSPLPLTGGLHAMWFLNNGLSGETAGHFLQILPVHSTLKQGRRKSASGQFDYRFNSDDKSIVAALTHFHSNIHFFTIAMAEPNVYGFPKDKLPHGRFSRPGELLAMMPPKAPPAILMNPNWKPLAIPRFSLLRP